MKKRGFEFSFAWLFAVFAGGTILFLAIFAATRVVNNSNFETNTEVAAQLDAILSPLETNLEDSKLYTIGLPQETRIFNTCREEGNFGQQQLSTSVISGIGEEWPRPGLTASFFNKYIFSDKVVQGKEIFVFVQPYSMPYKTADIMIIYTKKYCFVNAPGEIQGDIELAQLPKINFTDTIGNCDRDSVKVCFAGGNCDVDVNINSETVNKDGKTLSYYGSLLYGAIFSDSDVYICQVDRIKKRAAELAELYATKAALVDIDSCSAGLALELQAYSQNIASGLSLREVALIAKDIGGKNDNLECPLF